MFSPCLVKGVTAPRRLAVDLDTGRTLQISGYEGLSILIGRGGCWVPTGVSPLPTPSIPISVLLRMAQTTGVRDHCHGALLATALAGVDVCATGHQS